MRGKNCDSSRFANKDISSDVKEKKEKDRWWEVCVWFWRSTQVESRQRHYACVVRACGAVINDRLWPMRVGKNADIEKAAKTEETLLCTRSYTFSNPDSLPTPCFTRIHCHHCQPLETSHLMQHSKTREKVLSNHGRCTRLHQGPGQIRHDVEML